MPPHSAPPVAAGALQDWLRRLLDVALTQQKAVGIATTAAAGLVIAVLTLRPMGGRPAGHFDVCITCGTFWAADFGLNVLLFIPLGCGLRLAGLRRRTAWAVVLGSTVAVEVLQFSVVTGRDSDLSDIISNTIGGVLGVALADARRLLLAPSAAVTARLALGGALLWCAATALAQWALSVSLPHSVYYEQVAPTLGQFATFDGTVSDASFNGAPFPGGRLSRDASDAMREELVTGDARLTAVVVVGTPRRRLAPIISVFDQQRREIFVLGQRHNDLVFRIRRRSDNWGFHPPSLALANALGVQSTRDDTVHIDATVDAGAPRISARASGGQAARRVGVGIWQLWSLLVPDDGRYGEVATPITVVVVAMMFAPLGYWGGRYSIRAGIVRSMTPALLTLFAALAIIPWTVRSPAAPGPVWAAGLVAVSLAWTAARWMAPILDLHL